MLLKQLLAFLILYTLLYSFPFIYIIKHVIILFPALVYSYFWFEIGHECDISFFNKRWICNNFFSVYLPPWAPFPSVGSFVFHLSVTIFNFFNVFSIYLSFSNFFSIVHFYFSIVKRWHTLVFNFLLISCGLTSARFFPSDCSVPCAELWGNCLLLLDSLWAFQRLLALNWFKFSHYIHY